MSSVDRSENKRGVQNIPSGLTTDSVGRPRAAVDAGELKGEKCLEPKDCRTQPSGSPERQAQTPRDGGGTTQPGTRSTQPGTINWRRGPRGKPRELARTGRRALGAGRGTKASEPSEPPLARRSSGQQRSCASMPLPRWMISTRPVL